MLISSSDSRSCQHGFTLIEAMVAITIFAIALALGIPSMRDAVHNARIRTAAESILSGLQTARIEAVRRNAEVQFEFPTALGTDWTVTLRSSREVLQSSKGENSTSITATTDGKTAAAFDGLGRLTEDFNGNPSLKQIDINSTALAEADSTNLRILVDSGGEIRMCDPNTTAQGDPRRCTK